MIRYFPLSIVAFLISINSPCQDDYVPMLYEDARWIERQVAVTPDGFDYSYYTFAISGDTTINDTNYYKLYAVNGLVHSEVDVSPPYDQLFALIRETNEGQVFFRRAFETTETGISGNVLLIQSGELDEDDNFIPLPSDEEFLLFDFSLTEGDTIHSQSRVVQSVGTTTVNGESRKTITLSESYIEEGNTPGISNVEWTEGIGITPHLFYAYQYPNWFVFEYTIQFQCYSSSAMDYPEEYCSEILSVPQEQRSQEIKVFPNPTSERVNVHVENCSIPKELNVLSIDGCHIASYPSNNRPAQQLDISGLQSGIYLLQVTWKDGRVSNSKLVVE